MVGFSLDEPIKKQIPNGYRVCPNCWAYYHHPFHWCKNCSGVRTYKEKEMSWREFLTRTSHCGSGPLNTIYSILCKTTGTKHYSEELPKDAQKIYDEANEIYRTNGGWTGYRSFKGKMWISGKEVTHWICEHCGFKKEHVRSEWGKHCPKCNDYLHPARIIDGRIELVDKVK